jgi:hypothetical protein
LVRNVRTSRVPFDKRVEKLKAMCLQFGGSRFQVPGIIECDLAGELDRTDWRTFNGGLARVIKSSKGIPMRTCECHENAARVALSRKWECWTGLALSDDGIWRVHSWARVPSTGTLIETTVPRVKYLGVKLNTEDTEDLL